MELGEVQRPVVGVEQRGADEDEEAREGRQDEHLERRLERDRAFEEEAGQAVARERGDLEPDEQVEEVGGQRRPDQRGEQELEEAGVAAELARRELAQRREREEQQQRADRGGGDGEGHAERVGGEGDAERVAADGTTLPM